MKVLVFSDSHGDRNILKKVYEKEKPDVAIHLGDHFFDQDGLCDYVVKGNCDFGEAPIEQTIQIGDYKLFITHGHRYRVKYGIDLLIDKNREIGADIVLFGHTHCIFEDYFEESFFFNPGSISLPRGMDDPSYLTLYLGEDVEYEFCYI